MENNIITLNATVPTFKSKDLNTATKSIYEAVNAYNTTAAATRKQLALILHRVEAKKAYKEDGFRSLAEYAEKIGLDKSLTHKLENAGRLLDSKDEAIRDFAAKADYSKLAIMASAGDEEVKKAIAAGDIKPDSTQADVKTWKQKVTSKKAAAKPALVPDYKVFGMYYTPDGASKIDVERIALVNPKDFPDANGPTAKVPLAVTKAEDSTGEIVYTAVFDDHSVMVYTVERLAKAPKEAKPKQPDFSNFDDAAFAALLKEAAKRGLKIPVE